MKSANSNAPDLFFDRAEIVSGQALGLQERVGHGRDWSLNGLSAKTGYAASSYGMWRAGDQPMSMVAAGVTARAFGGYNGAEFLTQIFEPMGFAVVPLIGKASALDVNRATARYTTRTAEFLANDGVIDHRERRILVADSRGVVVTAGGFLMSERLAA